MAKNPWKVLNASTLYLSSRWSALFLSFCFAILYSRLLGVENRSVLTFILTIASLLVLGITSSLGLRLRQSISLHNDKRLVINKYLSDVLILTFMLLIAFILFILSYSLLVTSINIKILALASILLVTSNLTFGLSEMLIALDRIKSVSFFGNFEIVLQFILFSVAHYLIGFSLIISVLVGISVSYLVSSTIILMTSREYINLSALIANLTQNSRISKILTRDSLAVSLPFVFMDRLDKIIIGFMLPLPELSRYSIVLVFFSAFRSVPEAIARIRFGRHSINYSNMKIKLHWGVILLLSVIVGIYPIYRILISILLGSNWLVPLTSFLTVGIFEVARGFFLLQINHDFGDVRNSNTVVDILLLVTLSALLSFASIPLFGLVGVPASFGLSYFILILKQRLVNKK